MKFLTLPVLLLLGSLANAGEWGPMRSTASDQAIELRTLGTEVSLLWPARVAPGDDVLLTKSTGTIPGVIFFQSYAFVGVMGNSLRVEVSGSVQEKGQKSARPDASFTKVLLLERASDGSFYFTTTEIKSDGYFKITRASDRSPYYTVTLLKEKP